MLHHSAKIHVNNVNIELSLQLSLVSALTRNSAAAEISHVGGHYADQGHSRLPISVLIESPYAAIFLFSLACRC